MVAVRNSIPSPTTDPDELARRDVSRFRLAEDLRTSPDAAPIFQDPALQGPDPELGFDEESRRTNTIAAFRKQAQEQAEASLETVAQQPIQEVTPGLTPNQLESRQVSVTRPEQKAPAPPTPDQEAAEAARLEARAARIKEDLPTKDRIKWYQDRGMLPGGDTGSIESKAAGQAARLAAFGALTREDRFEASKEGSQTRQSLDSVSRVAEALKNPDAEVSDVDLVRFAEATKSKTAVINDSRRETESLRQQVTDRRRQGIQEGRASVADRVAGLNLEDTTPAAFDAIIKEAVAELPSIERSAALADARANLPEPIQAQLKIDRDVELAEGKAGALSTVRSKELNDLNFSQNFSTVKARLNPDSPAAQIGTYEELAANPEALALFNTYMKDEATLVNGKVVDRTPKKGKGATAGGREFTEAEITALEAGAPGDAAILKQAAGVKDYVAGEGDMIVYKGTQPLENRIASTARRLMGDGADLPAALEAAARELIGSEESLNSNTAAEILGFKGNAARDLLIEGATLRTDELGQANRIKSDEALADATDSEGKLKARAKDIAADAFAFEAAGNGDADAFMRGELERSFAETLDGRGLGLASEGASAKAVEDAMTFAKADLQGLRDEAAKEDRAQLVDSTAARKQASDAGATAAQADAIFDNNQQFGYPTMTTQDGVLMKSLEGMSASAQSRAKSVLIPNQFGAYDNVEARLASVNILNTIPANKQGVPLGSDSATIIDASAERTEPVKTMPDGRTFMNPQWELLNGNKEGFYRATFADGTGKVPPNTRIVLEDSLKAFVATEDVKDRDGNLVTRKLTLEEFAANKDVPDAIKKWVNDASTDSEFQAYYKDDPNRAFMRAINIGMSKDDGSHTTGNVQVSDDLGKGGSGLPVNGVIYEQIADAQAANRANRDNGGLLQQAKSAYGKFELRTAEKRKTFEELKLDTKDMDDTRDLLSDLITAAGGTPQKPGDTAGVKEVFVSEAEANLVAKDPSLSHALLNVREKRFRHLGTSGEISPLDIIEVDARQAALEQIVDDEIGRLSKWNRLPGNALDVTNPQFVLEVLQDTRPGLTEAQLMSVVDKKAAPAIQSGRDEWLGRRSRVLEDEAGGRPRGNSIDLDAVTGKE